MNLTVDEPKGTATEVLKNLVMVTADTIGIDSVRVSTSASYQIVTVPVYIHNQFQCGGMYVPFQVKMNGETVSYQKIRLLSTISTEGTLSEYFEDVSITPYDHWTNRYGISISTNYGGVGSEFLQPGAGILVNLDFKVEAAVVDGSIFTIDTISQNMNSPLQLSSLYGVYYPEFIGGKIFVKDEICGDLNKDLKINILDAVYIIQYKYKNGPPPEPVSAGDINLDGTIDLADVIYLINYKYKDGPEPCNP